MAKTPSRCLFCGGPLQWAPPPETGALRCPRCDAAIGMPEGHRPTAGQPALQERASPGRPLETRAEPRNARVGPPTLSPSPRSTAGGQGWWKTARASAKGSMLGVPVGAVAGVLWLIVGGGAGSSDGSGAAAILLLPVFGAVVGFLLGLGIPWLWAWWKTSQALAVGSMWGAFAGAVTGVMWAILIEASGSSYHRFEIAAPIIGFGFCGAVVGFLLGFAIPLLWWWWKRDRASAVGSMAGMFAGAVGGVVLWILGQDDMDVVTWRKHDLLMR